MTFKQRNGGELTVNLKLWGMIIGIFSSVAVAIHYVIPLLLIPDRVGASEYKIAENQKQIDTLPLLNQRLTGAETAIFNNQRSIDQMRDTVTRIDENVKLLLRREEHARRYDNDQSP